METTTTTTTCVKNIAITFSASRVAVTLIAAVVAVELSVALERAAYAASVSTAEFRLAAVAGHAAAFIGIVSAIIVVITAPASGDTFTVVALEVGRLARVDVGIATSERLVLTLGAIFIAVALPRRRNATT